MAQRAASADGAAAPPVHARISRVAVSNPSGSFTQEEMLGLLGLRGNAFAEDVFARCGVARRRLDLSPEDLELTMQQRASRTERRLLELAMEAVDRLAADQDEVGTVITATYNSLGGPTLAHQLVDSCGLDPATDKYHVVGVGCASAVPLFKLAGQALRDHPEKRALVVAAESSSSVLNPVREEDEKTKVVGSALFGDGCAAALLTAEAGDAGPEIVSARVHQLEGTLDSVGLRVSGDDSYMHIARELPSIAATRVQELVEDFLGGHDLAPADVDHWLVHPGGRGIVEGVQEGLSLTDEQVAVSWDVLAEFGNMGTPSSFYVLKETVERRRPRPGDLGLTVAIGPGVTVGLMLLGW